MPKTFNPNDQLATQLKPYLKDKLNQNPSIITELTFTKIADLMNQVADAKSKNLPPIKIEDLMKHYVTETLKMDLLTYQVAIDDEYHDDYETLINEYVTELHHDFIREFDDKKVTKTTPVQYRDLHDRYLKLSQKKMTVMESREEPEFDQRLIQASHYYSYVLIDKLANNWQ